MRHIGTSMFGNALKSDAGYSTLRKARIASKEIFAVRVRFQLRFRFSTSAVGSRNEVSHGKQ